MKKTLIAAIALIAFAFTACQPTEPTKTELLTKKGWTLSTATSIPAFENKSGVTNENLFVSFFWDCEKDDILNFNQNGSSIMDLGKLICDDQTGKELSLGNWRFLKNEEVLEFYLPYFFNEDNSLARLEAKIVALDANTLTLRIPLEYDNGLNPAKSGKIRNDRGVQDAKSVKNYEFILTYKVAK